MSPLRTIACGALALSAVLVTNLSTAAEPSKDQLTRAQARAGAIDARDAGQDRVGDDPYYPYGPDTTVLKPARSKAKKAKNAAPVKPDATASATASK